MKTVNEKILFLKELKYESEKVIKDWTHDEKKYITIFISAIKYEMNPLVKSFNQNELIDEIKENLAYLTQPSICNVAVANTTKKTEYVERNFELKYDLLRPVKDILLEVQPLMENYPSEISNLLTQIDKELTTENYFLFPLLKEQEKRWLDELIPSY